MIKRMINKADFILRDRGLFGLICFVIVKAGQYLERSGHRIERSLYNSGTTQRGMEKRHFVDSLETISKSYLISGDKESSLFPLKVENEDVICWIVPPFSKGSGGHTTLFRFIRGLEKRGLKSKILLLNDMPVSLTAERVKSEIGQFFGPIDSEVEVITPFDIRRRASIIICTSWQTAYAARVMEAKRKIYFMQDFEPYFSPIGAYSHFAEETYRFGFEFFTAGPWLLSTVQKKYDGIGEYFTLCPDRSIYFPRTNFEFLPLLSQIQKKDRPFLVGLYNRVNTSRRCVELAWVALDLVAQRGAKILVYTFGEDEKHSLPFPNQSLGILNHEELAQMYTGCDLIIAPSATNLSLLAREVMACGGLVLDLEGENTQAELVHEVNSVLCKATVDSFVEQIESLISSHEKLNRVKSRISGSISDLPEWDEQFLKMANFLSPSV
ncbi:MAG: hypothetical protein EOP04_13760 [Proteobacteria bacterium]|nr:MAG: hypothetical protein EOP04_13760 [Pseudomonadota bacterium]